MPDQPQINPTEISTTTVYLLLGRLEKMCENGFDGVHARLDKLNGRMGDAEQDIAVLKDRAAQAEHRAEAAKDRADEAVSTSEGAKGSARWWSIGLSSAIVTIIEVVRQIYGTK